MMPIITGAVASISFCTNSNNLFTSSLGKEMPKNIITKNTCAIHVKRARRKILKKIALLGITILSFGVLTACSSNDNKKTETRSSPKITKSSKVKGSSSSSTTMKSSSTQLQTSESEQAYQNEQIPQDVKSTTSESQPVEKKSTDTLTIPEQTPSSKKVQAPAIDTNNTTDQSTTPSQQMEEQENQRKLEAGKQKVRDYFSELNKTTDNKYPLDKVEYRIQDLFQFINFNRSDMGTPDEQINLRVEQTIDAILNGSW